MSSYAGTANVNVNNMTRSSVSSARAGKRRRLRRTSRNLIRAIGALVIAVFVLIGLSAYAASLQHANNVLIEQNQYLQAEIDSLNSRIVEETRVTRIEELATEEYGMIYPTKDNCIVISENAKTGDNLAAVIRNEAYN